MENKYIRCDWCIGDSLCEQYHDQEWGVPVFDDLKFFEFLTLETFQVGLSWITVLRKRENFRRAFDQFDIQKVALYDDAKIKALLNNEGIVRNKQKIVATVNNAHRFMEIQIKHNSFSEYIWGFVAAKPLQNSYKTLSEIPAKTALSEIISKDFKKKGFQFVGPTMIYALMQATGMVNDHLIDCFRYKVIK